MTIVNQWAQPNLQNLISLCSVFIDWSDLVTLNMPVTFQQVRFLTFPHRQHHSSSYNLPLYSFCWHLLILLTPSHGHFCLYANAFFLFANTYIKHSTHIPRHIKSCSKAPGHTSKLYTRDTPKVASPWSFLKRTTVSQHQKSCSGFRSKLLFYGVELPIQRSLVWNAEFFPFLDWFPRQLNYLNIVWG